MIRKLKRWWHDNATLFFAQGLISTLRGAFRVQEALAPPEKQAKLRQFRDRMDHLERQKQEMLEVSKDRVNDGPLQMLEKMERMQKEHGTPEEVARIRTLIEKMRAMDNESETLKRLRDENEHDPVRQIAVMRDYCAEFPDSELGLSALIGALSKENLWDEAIEVAQSKIQLIERNGSTEAKAFRLVSGKQHIAVLFLEKGEAQEAISLLEKLIQEQRKDKSNVSLSTAYLTLGDAYRKRGAMSEAEKSWKDALRNDDFGLIKIEVAKRLKEAQ